jgi:hypothetical protein
MSRHEFMRPGVVEPAAAHTPPAPTAAEVAHDDLAVRLPDWDLLPVAEFVRRRPAGG